MNTTPVIINIGCGRRRMAGTIGIDRIALPTVDIVADVEEGLPFLADDSVDMVIADSTPEHVTHFSIPDYFSVYSPFRWRNRLFNNPMNVLVNISRWTQKFYEENLCWLSPCYMLEFTLRPVK
jgi:hypothetical protein